jgi:hypothetical protein
LGTRTTAPHGRSISTTGEVRTISGTNSEPADIDRFMADCLRGSCPFFAGGLPFAANF